MEYAINFAIAAVILGAMIVYALKSRSKGGTGGSGGKPDDGKPPKNQN